MLPKEKSKKKTSMQDYSWLLYGAPKLGKSSFCSMFPKTLVFDTQQGYEFLEVYKVNVNSWTGFLEALGELEKSSCDASGNVLPDAQFTKIALFDTIDDLYKMCFDYVCAKHKFEHPADEGYGKGWSLINDEFKRVIMKLLKYKPIFISHAVDKEYKTQIMTTTKTQPTLSGQSGVLILALADIIGYIATEKGERYIKTKGDTYSLVAGDRTGLLPENVPFSYEKIKEAFETHVTKEKK